MGQRNEIQHWTLIEVAQHVAAGDVSAEEVARSALDTIEELNTPLGAFLTVTADQMLTQARAVDARRTRGEPLGKLAGVPLGIKDALCTRGVPTTCGSKILVRGSEPWRPPYDATTVARLWAEGALLAGKCNMDEFAMGSSTENSAFFPARNPADPTRTPGGSSGGSAVAVAARMIPGALGSDTGGSVRQPAAYTGCVGVKPTYGRVSRFGLIAYASSLDVVGPMASDVRGAARLLEVIAGHDPRDGTSLDQPVDAYEAACERGVRGLRVGVPEEYFGTGLQPEVKTQVEAAIHLLEREGATLVPVHLPHTRHAVATYYVIATAEASSNLARFDGVRFGLRHEPPAGDVTAMYEATRGKGFGPEVKRRIVLGTYVLSHGYYDAYYRKAQQVRTLIRRDFDQVFGEVDVIATPTAPTVAFLLGEQLDDPLTMYLNDVYTLPANLAGLPALSVPVAPAPPSGGGSPLPVGLQLLGPPLAEARLFAAAAVVEAMLTSRQPPGALSPTAPTP
ncbi:MAG: Asp-tRNA(Asn)/Glu-tRNA(Gln) amidotransferase subunit GatA [Myxococcales bacterium]|nr:Asp-tRNA(Asn)/Glu-tRNA(Gln) amidotransferase subunit GatA [Polyangiaceae bacterium]MDW8247909.1 Asp-tRNA(Asn)/Glu-tRNA(Gln) amidotransferase subunit GatA [Myxococcales bacterium]